MTIIHKACYNIKMIERRIEQELAVFNSSAPGNVVVYEVADDLPDGVFVVLSDQLCKMGRPVLRVFRGLPLTPKLGSDLPTRDQVAGSYQLPQ